MAFEISRDYTKPQGGTSTALSSGVLFVGGKPVGQKPTPSVHSVITSDPLMTTAYRSIGEKGHVDFNRTTGFRRGRFSANPFLRSSRTNSCSSTSGSCKRWATRYGFYVWTNDHIGDLSLRCNIGAVSLSASLPTSSSALSTAMVNSIAKSKSAEVDLTVNAFEAASTIKMLASPIRSMIPLLKQLKRSNAFKRSKKWYPTDAFSYASSKWLELRYGLLPLMGDIEAGRKFVDNCLSTDNRLRSKRSKSVVSSQTSVKRSVTADPYSYMRLWYVDRSYAEQFYYNIYYFRVVDSYGYNLTKLGLNGLGVFTTAWELIPFSFVVDWFVGIGNWLTYARPAPELNAVACVYGRVGYTKLVRSIYGIDYYDVPIIPISCECTAEKHIFERIGSSTDFPLLYPQLGAGISTLTRAFDSASLLWQTLPKLPNFLRKR